MKFKDIGLHPSVLAGVEANNFEDCTPIQEASIPHILSGQDLAGLAQTGTGKTAAFVLPLIDRIVRSREAMKTGESAEAGAPADAAGATTTTPGQTNRPIFKGWRRTNFILVLVPTRELAEQVYENVGKFGKSANVGAVAVYGGTGYDAQKAALRQGVEFVVATPGRLIDLYKEHHLDLNQVRAIVFDEADRMFDMGFKDDMKYILRRVPQDRQFLVFSATLNFDVLNTAYEFGANPTEVNVSRDQAKAENVVDEIFHVGQQDKPQYLLSILQKYKPKQAIIFSNFKHNVEKIAKFLSQNGIPAMGISSLISQNQRTRIMELFRAENNDRNILVATDVAARGLDIKGVDLVVNFELPDDSENYVHRIGRTGRAGAKGHAYSLVSDRDVEALQRIESYLDHKLAIGWLEDADIIKDFKSFASDEGRRPREFKREGEFSRREGRPQHRRHQGEGRRRHGERRDRPNQGQPGTQSQQPSRGQQRTSSPRHSQQQHNHRPHHKSTHRHPKSGPHQQKNSRPQRPSSGYNYKPTDAQPQKGLMSSVKGFFKKLFVGD